MRRRDQRGASLAWAMLVLAAVSTAMAIAGGAMARRLRTARLASEAAALEDLHASALAIGRLRARDAAWRGPESVELAGGRATVRLEWREGRALLLVESTASLTGRVAIASEALDLRAPDERGPQPLGLTARY